MDFSASNLIAGFIFGVFGVYLIKRAKDQANISQFAIGIVLTVYPYFLSNALLVWTVGIGLLVAAYQLE